MKKIELVQRLLVFLMLFPFRMFLQMLYFMVQISFIHSTTIVFTQIRAKLSFRLFVMIDLCTRQFNG